jgi:peroxiredoxin
MRPDLRPGGRLPDLTLVDHRGESVTLSKLASGFPIVLSFYRGYW